MRFLAPPQATLLGALTVGGGSMLFAALGSWPLVTAIAVLDHDGWPAVGRIARKWVMFPVIPSWFSPNEITIANWSILLTIAGVGVGGRLGQLLWQFLVVKTFGWMTDKEVEEFWKRDPGF